VLFPANTLSKAAVAASCLAGLSSPLFKILKIITFVITIITFSNCYSTGKIIKNHSVINSPKDKHNITIDEIKIDESNNMSSSHCD
jgi:hypothetical protein